MDRLTELRQAVAGGEHLRVMRLAYGLLQSPEGLTDSEALEAARSGAGAAMAVRQVYTAVQFTDRARAWADATGNQVEIAIAAYHQGTVALHTGDWHMADVHLSEFHEADTPPRRELDRYRGAARFNTGNTFLGQRQYALAETWFRLAAEAFAEVGEMAARIRATLQAAWAQLMDHRPEDAGASLSVALELMGEHRNDELSTTYMTYRAFYHWRTGELPRAVSLTQEVLTPGRPGVSPHQVADAAWIAGECALALGMLGEARGLAAAATDAALQAGMPSAMSRAQDLRRRIHEAEQQSA